MNINDLPHEVLLQIFRYLDPYDWFFGECVCGQWRKIFGEFWKEVKEIECGSTGDIQLILQDSRSFRLQSSEIGWKTDTRLLEMVLLRCGEQVEKINLHVPKESDSVDVQAVFIVGSLCKNLKALSFDGYVSALADCISLICHDLYSLEEVSIWDEIFAEDVTEMESTSANLIGDLVTVCTQLRRLNVNLIYIPPPSLETCRRLSSLENLERLRWLFWSTLQPEYVEGFLANLTECGGNLRDLGFCCKLKSPLNGEECGKHLRRLAANGNLVNLNLAFQLYKPLPNDDDDESGHIFYEPTEEAPWSLDILSALTSFNGIQELTLSYFDLSGGLVLAALKELCQNLRVLRLEDNYNVTGELTWSLSDCLQRIRAIHISQACLSHGDLVELIARCPGLEMLCVSNVESLSFKKLVLGAHSTVHHCGRKSSGQSHTLNLRLETARGYVHEEAKQLKYTPLCGLKLLPPSHSNVMIDRICKKL